MKINHVATFSLLNALRNQTAEMQTDLSRLQKEVVTGTLADSGLELGALSEQLVSYKSDITDIDRIIDTNNAANARLAMTQAGLEQLAVLSDDLTEVLGLVFGEPSQAGAVVNEADNMLEQMTSVLNTQVNGVHIFGGVNVQDAPISGHRNGPGEAAFDAAFAGYFGFAKTDAAAATITDVAMNDFLENVLMPQFLGVDWGTNYSTASDELIQSRIGPDLVRGTSVSANEEGVRRMMLGAVVAREMFDAPLSDAARDAAGLFAVAQTQTGNAQMIDVRARTGLVESQITEQNRLLTAQRDVFTGFITDMEGVDQFETSVRLTNLLTQIEASYATTARIQNLSLMRYL